MTKCHVWGLVCSDCLQPFSVPSFLGLQFCQEAALKCP
jgi:hypothetical protein